MYGLILNNGSWMNAIGLEQDNTGYQYDFPVIYPSTNGMVHSERKSRHYNLDFLGMWETYPAWDLSTLTLPHVMFTLKNNHAVIIDTTGIYVSDYGGASIATAGRINGNTNRNIKYVAAFPFVIRSVVMNNSNASRCGIYFRWSEGNTDRNFYAFLQRTDQWLANWRDNPPHYPGNELSTGSLSNFRDCVAYLGKDYYTINDVTLDTSVVTSYDIGNASVTTRPLYFYYDGTPKIPILHVVMPSGAELTEGVDYTVTFRDNVEVGTGVAELTGIGDYHGTRIKGFAIYPENTGGGGNPNIPPSGPGGGGGDGPPPSDPIPEPEPLIISSADTGFTRIYNPTLPELQDFAHYMWTDNNILQTVINHVKQYFEDPMDAFIALNILPVQVPNSASPEMVRLLFLDTGKYMKTATNQFVTVELGELTLSENYKSALDYAPNTKIDLFLPYIGTVPIDADEVMGRTVKLTYKVDICSGTCVAILKVRLDDTNFYPLYQFSGNCAIRIPFTSANMDGYINAGIGAAKIALGAVVGGALGAAAAAAAPPSTTSNAQPSAPVSDVPRTQMNFISPARSAESVAVQEQDKRDAVAAKWNNVATVARASTAAIGIRAGAKASFAHSSGFVGNSGYMSYKVPFFIMKVPRLVNPDQYGKYNGFPSLMYQNFSDLKGYTEIQQVQLTNMTATSNEKDEIQSLLKSGVIF